MLQVLFPQAHRRYASLALLGPCLDSFVTWLAERGYQSSTVRVMLRPMARVDQWLQRQGAQTVADLDPDILEACWAALRRGNSSLGGVIRALAQYLESTGVLPPRRSGPQTRNEQLVSRYEEHLTRVRGFAQSSVGNHVRTVSAFLNHVGVDAASARLPGLAASDIESFVRRSGQGLARSSLQQLVAHLRGFLRFLVAVGEGPAGLADTIDTPRLYRHEQLPRCLPWSSVTALLASIDRGTPAGLRDHTMLLLIAAYGLRVSEVAALALDHLHWREGWLQVPQPKTRSALRLPLTDTVGSALDQYLREARPQQVSGRHLFLRTRAPVRPLTPNAVSMVFRRWAGKCPVAIPWRGAHCLRHSYAVHLLRSGVSVKTIGDLLGHRDAESTGVYLRLAIEDLREVALPMPATTGVYQQQEMAP